MQLNSITPVQPMQSSGNNANALLYAEVRRAAHHLFWLYSDGWQFPFTWEDLMHDVLAGLDFDCSQIALFSYRFKIALKKAKESQYSYLKHIARYYEYESTPMPDVEFPDFPVGANYETCIRFLVKELGGPITAQEATKYIRQEDYTRRYLKNLQGVEMVMRRLDSELVKIQRPEQSKKVSGLRNGRAKMTLEMQVKAKELYALMGKKYKAIGREIGVSKDTVRDFILGRSYRCSEVV